MSNIDPILVQDQILVGGQLYTEAIDIILTSAEREILIFDQDLRHGNFSSKQKAELFQQFLNKSSNNQLMIILQETSYFLQSCPRLMSLLEIYGHKMAVFETNQTVKHAKDCFILVDKKNYIKRIHVDQARFRYGLNDLAYVGVLSARFQELQDAIQQPVTITKLGL
jgi:hypothetical protein